MKTKFDSYTTSTLPHGCQFCLRGQKLVLFIGGKCSRNCWYCSLSEGRKNSPQMWANERPCKTNADIIKETTESNAKGAGITGGDPLVYLNKTISAARALKNKFGKSFHIHIYLPLPLVNKTKLEKLHKYIDEVRFHPSFLTFPDKKTKSSIHQPLSSQVFTKSEDKRREASPNRAGRKFSQEFSGRETSRHNPSCLNFKDCIMNSSEKLMQEEIEKIKQAQKIFGKTNTGIELPLLPEKKNEIISFIKKVANTIGFVNLNEFELSDTNFKQVTNNYTLNQDTYTVHQSKEAGKQILKHFAKSKLKIHLCTAKTKNLHQYHNRLLRHNILPFGIRTQDATVVYVEIPYTAKNKKEIIKELKPYKNHFYVDTKNSRIILNQKKAHDIYKTKKFDIRFSEEHPTFDAEKMSYWKLSDTDFE